MSRTDGLPVVDVFRCNSCGDCVAACPTQCLELRWGLPELARPRDCVSCALCALVCPVEAIELVDPVRA